MRPARPDDYAAVAAFTRNTWDDRGVGDYLPDVYHEWIADDGPRQRTLVVDVDDEIAGIAQASLLSKHEGWTSGLRINPDYRGRGYARDLTYALFDWLRDAGASVARNLVFSWNTPSLGLSRDVGFDPCTEFRWAHPTPDADASVDDAYTVEGDPDAGWSFWTRSEARTHLRGLALAPDESWALAELTRSRLHDAADGGRLLTVERSGTCGVALRNQTYERTAEEDPETVAEYAVGAWRDVDAAAALLGAIARDAAAVEADRTRLLIPESVEWVTDAAAARTRLAESPEFVLAADLTDSSNWG